MGNVSCLLSGDLDFCCFFLQIFQRIQQQAAFIEFSQKNFEEALDLFKNGKIDVREVCKTYYTLGYFHLKCSGKKINSLNR